VSGVGGALISGATANLPTGPTIVLCMGVLVIGSLLVAPNRGLLWTWWQTRRTSRRLRRERVLSYLYTLARKHRRPDHPHEAATLDAIMDEAGPTTAYVLRQLADQGLVEQTADGRWKLTPDGVEAAQSLAADRNLIPDTDAP
jgi:manganese/zinc/iron transport system permease protein